MKYLVPVLIMLWLFIMHEIIMLRLFIMHGEEGDCYVERAILDKCLESLSTSKAKLCEVCKNDSSLYLPGSNCTVLMQVVCDEIHRCGCNDCMDESMDFASCTIDLVYGTSCDLRCGQSNQRPPECTYTYSATMPLKAGMLLMSVVLVGLVLI